MTSKKCSRIQAQRPALFAILAGALLLIAGSATGQQGYGFAHPTSYGIKIYKAESLLYPFVQVYFRTFDQNQRPLVNLNEMNIGIMVKGRSYDPIKRQYFVQSIQQPIAHFTTVACYVVGYDGFHGPEV